MSNNNSTYLDFFQQQSFQNWTEEQITHDLLGKGFVEEKIAEIIQHYKKKKQEERSNNEFTSKLFTPIDFIRFFIFDLIGIDARHAAGKETANLTIRLEIASQSLAKTLERLISYNYALRDCFAEPRKDVRKIDFV